MARLWAVEDRQRAVRRPPRRDRERRGDPRVLLHPGSIFTELQRDITPEEGVALGWTDAEGNVIAPGFKTPSQGAATGLWAATSPDLASHGGAYCENCDIAPLASPDGSMNDGGVRHYAVDPASAERLWEVSAQMTAIDGASAGR